jgi:hypothetical protein
VVKVQGQYALQVFPSLILRFGQPGQSQPGFGASWVGFDGSAQQATRLIQIALAGRNPPGCCQSPGIVF